jgi:hypothetical protein
MYGSTCHLHAADLRRQAFLAEAAPARLAADACPERPSVAQSVLRCGMTAVAAGWSAIVSLLLAVGGDGRAQVAAALRVVLFASGLLGAGHALAYAGVVSGCHGSCG